MDSFIKFFKDLKVIITLVLAILVSLGIKVDINLLEVGRLIKDFDLHIFSFVIVSHILLHKRILATSNQQLVAGLKGRVDSVYKEFKNVAVIDSKTSIMAINDLEKERKKLGINSYTEKRLKALIDKMQ